MHPLWDGCLHLGHDRPFQKIWIRDNTRSKSRKRAVWTNRRVNKKSIFYRLGEWVLMGIQSFSNQNSLQIFVYHWRVNWSCQKLIYLYRYVKTQCSVHLFSTTLLVCLCLNCGSSPFLLSHSISWNMSKCCDCSPCLASVASLVNVSCSQWENPFSSLSSLS